MDWYRPVSLEELLELRRNYPGDASKLVVGNTRVQWERYLNPTKFSRLIALSNIEELQQMKQTADSLYLGAGVTFARLKSKLIEWVGEKINDGGFSEALLNQLRYFASTQIRNVASIGGNIIAASPM